MSQTNGVAAGGRLLRAVTALSEALLTAERFAIGSLMALLTALILLNVVTRYGGAPLYWIDESAIFTAVWLTFIGASATSRLRLDFSMTLLTEHLPSGPARAMRVVSTLCILGFGLALAAMCWVWMDPVGIASAGFDAREYGGATFNFLYTERTQTLNWPSWVVYLVIPLFAFTLIAHSAANLIEDLGLAAPPDRSRIGLHNAEEVA
ncbi:TRAP transporter small permease [Ancylobacter dichloromethanicus]|uniref:TRAP transporter small permease protein n=1 Tax=Ancylobacter dichloromethanicus TaxID=518825 RepID=A0A9W6N0Z3_9HYPH|nr:TRAP transporter small permease [Ancylobacter dichloromethanicus]MBS7556661.1 TRAP transporter small permease [Ancylobacter dichloromethanicus]GLK73512.1 C4-dicarboxylate ABC transporter permease [Ancylobacter dichloromethanicus]